MKKIGYLFSVFLLMLILVGCGRTPLAVTFQNATMAGSDSNTIKVLFSKEKFYDDKVYDIWIKSNKDNSNLILHYENQENLEINLEKKDFWYSLTNLKYEYLNKAGSEDFISFENALNLTLIIESENECELTLKSVIGDKIQNADKTGFLISNTEDISKEYTQKITPLNR